MATARQPPGNRVAAAWQRRGRRHGNRAVTAWRRRGNGAAAARHRRGNLMALPGQRHGIAMALHGGGALRSNVDTSGFLQLAYLFVGSVLTFLYIR